MFTAITETANVVSPFTTAVSNGILKSISAVSNLFDRLTGPSRAQLMNNVARHMKDEYPWESEDYVYFIVRTQMFGEKE
jgi:putative cell wall-binding protein